MIVAALVCAALLAAGALLALVRAERGPSMLDRTLALDVLTSIMVAAIAVEAAWSRRVDTIPILVALSVVGFIGSVTIARFAAVEPEGEGRVLTRAEVAALEARRRAEEDPGRSDDDEHHGGGAEGEVRE